MLGRIPAEVELGPTQFGSQRRKGYHDMMATLYEFLKYYKKLERGLMSMDIEGGFDKIDTWLLCQLMAARGCGLTLCRWVARWAGRRSVKFRFNGRLSREYYINQGISQGSPLSPFLFGIYMADILSPCLLCSPSVASVVLSYVDDGVIAVAGISRGTVVVRMGEVFEDCRRVAGLRGMGFSVMKTQ